jgi:hypothetical protein
MDKFLDMLADFKKRIERLENIFNVFVQSWTAPSLLNSWVNFDSGTYTLTGYYRDPSGRVHLRGNLKNGTINTAMFTLPANYRPQYKQRFVCVSNGALGIIEVDTSGNVTCTTGNNTYVSIDGISFRAYQ